MKYLKWNKRRIFYSEDDILDYVNNHNGKTRCYISLYGFTDIFDNKPDLNTIIVDKIMIEGNYNNILSVYNSIKNKGNDTILIFDGSVYQLLVMLDDDLDWVDLEAEIEKLHEYLKVNCKDLDSYIINNNPEKMVLIPKTWNPKTKKFCVAFKNTFPSKEEIISKAVEGYDLTKN